MEGYRPGHVPGKVRRGYYLDPALVERMKIAAIRARMTESALVEEAIRRHVRLLERRLARQDERSTD